MDQISKIVIVGAGKTGRGFLARLLNGNEIIFIDKNKELVDALNVEKKFDVFFFGNDHSPVTVGFSEALTWENVDSRLFDGAEVVLVSVGGNNLADVGIELKKYINKDNKIIVCENASSPAKKLYDSIGIDGLKISESTVFCTTIEKEKGTLAINSEWYPYLQYDSDAFGGNVIDINGLKAVSNFSGFLDRKLYTYNSASCIIAYLGALKGYSLYSDAANDPEILGLLDRNYEIINECICKEYGYDENDQREFALLSRIKFTDKSIVDTIARNAREPQRKITRKERIVAPMLLEQKYGKDSSVLEKTLAAAFLYNPPEEAEWNKMLEENGYEMILQNICGLDKNTSLYSRILNIIQRKTVLL